MHYGEPANIDELRRPHLVEPDKLLGDLLCILCSGGNSDGLQAASTASTTTDGRAFMSMLNCFHLLLTGDVAILVHGTRGHGHGGFDLMQLRRGWNKSESVCL